jgi:hypothetical protein
MYLPRSRVFRVVGRDDSGVEVVENKRREDWTRFRRERLMVDYVKGLEGGL